MHPLQRGKLVRVAYTNAKNIVEMSAGMLSEENSSHMPLPVPYLDLCGRVYASFITDKKWAPHSCGYLAFVKY